MSPSVAQVDTSDAPISVSAEKKNIHISQSVTPIPNGHRDSPAELDASSICVTLSESSRAESVISTTVPVLSSVCTDHMVTAQWTIQGGWAQPQLKPYGPLSIMPTASVLHYATTCFEGMKVYRGFDGKLRLFRPSCNTNRMVLSANRIALPSFPPDELLKLIVKLCAVEGPKWLPRGQPGKMLYVRPTLIGDDPSLGVQRPKQALLYVLLSMMPIMDRNREGIRLLASEEETSGVRAWPGGHGWAKVGANYGPTLMAQGEAMSQGFTQVLWLLRNATGKVEVTEAGASNFFIVWKTREGKTELVTPPLGQRVILDGVTRRSVLQLARERLGSNNDVMNSYGVEDIKVTERPVEMREIEEAVAEGRMVEAFAAGTAFFVAPISMIRYYGKDLVIPMAEGSSGTYARILKNWLSDIMYGNEQHEWGYVVDEEGQ